MSTYNLDKIFEPSSVAVIGASEKKGSVGCSLIENVIEGGYRGKIFPVNPQYKIIKDLDTYPSISDIEQPVDLVILATPIIGVPSIIRDCVEAKVGGVIIISVGGRERGLEGKKLEEEIKGQAGRGGLRIVGPNCIGIISSESRLNATFAGSMPPSGNLAFISQSGAICAAILDLSQKEGIGFRYFVSIGSMLDVDYGDLINYMGDDPDVSSIALYLESLTNMRKFMSAARAVSRVKPIVVLKAGESGAGARAASSHVGALAGEDAVYEAAFKRAGIVRVKTVGELFDCAEVMAKQSLPTGPGLAIITNGGGPGVMAADVLAFYGLEPVPLSPETMKKLDEFLPPFWSKGNPINILGDASPERWQRSIEVCLSAREIKALVIILVPQSMGHALAVSEIVLELLSGKPHPPIFAVWMGGENAEEGRQVLNKAGIPTYETPERAIAAFKHMYSYKRNLEMLYEVPSKLPVALKFDRSSARENIEKALKEGNTLLTEAESKALLKAYGIPVNRTAVADSPDKAIQLAQDMGYPVVMKVNSRDILHKSDVHGVKLNLRREKDVSDAFSKIMANARTYAPKAELLGVTVQPMFIDPDYELILGSKMDADFGPVILFGMGGIMTEIMRDLAIALPPLNRLLARRLIEGTRVYQMLRGYRNRPPARLALLEEVLVRLSQLVTDFPEIAELDINPMILLEDRACAVDARVIIKPSDVIAPHHLVISPYPNEYEMTTTTKAGVRLFVRPIKPEDSTLLQDLFNNLSPQTIYYRFFSPIKSLPPKMLARFTQIDYDRDIALVAIDRAESTEKLLGVARLMGNPEGTKAEFSVVIADSCQGKGIGVTLMERLIAIARERGMESVWGAILAENKNMLALAKKLGFVISRGPDASQYEARIDLRSMTSG